MKIKLFTCLLMVIVLSLKAQNNFQRTYGGANDEEALCVQQTSDQGYVMCGYSKSFNSGIGCSYAWANPGGRGIGEERGECKNVWISDWNWRVHQEEGEA